MCRKFFGLFYWCRIPFVYGQPEEGSPEDDAIMPSRRHENEIQGVDHPIRSRTDEEEGLEEEENTNTVVQSAKYNGLISSTQLLITLVVVTSVVILSESVFGGNENCHRILMLGFMAIALCIMVAIYKFKDSFLSPQRETAEHENRDNLTLIGIVTFCVLGCMYHFLLVMDKFTCSGLWILCNNAKVIRSIIISIVFHVSRIFYLAAQTLFCMIFNKSTFANRNLTRQALMYLQAVNVIFWFYSILRESKHVFKHHDGGKHHHLPKRFNSCNFEANSSAAVSGCVSQNNSASEFLHEVVSPSLRPFTIEFSLLVGESLVYWFISCSRSGGNNSRSELHQSTNATVDGEGLRSPVSRSRKYETRSRGVAQRRETADDDVALLDAGLAQPSSTFGYRPFTVVLWVGLAVLASLLLCVSKLLPKFFSSSTSARNNYLVKIYYVYRSIYIFSMILLQAIGYIVSNQFPIKKHVGFSGIDYMVVFSSAGPLASAVFGLLAIGASRNSCEAPSVFLWHQTLQFAQVSFQVAFLLYAGRVEVEKRPGNLVRRSCFRGIVFYLALCNGTLWASHTFRYSALFEDALRCSYGHEGRAVLIVVLLPLILFFRFNSCLLLARVFFQTRSQRKDRRV